MKGSQRQVESSDYFLKQRFQVNFFFFFFNLLNYFRLNPVCLQLIRICTLNLNLKNWTRRRKKRGRKPTEIFFKIQDFPVSSQTKTSRLVTCEICSRKNQQRRDFVKMTISVFLRKSLKINVFLILIFNY